MFRTIARLTLTAALLLLAACSSDAPPPAALKTQTDALHKAEDVNTLIDDAATKQRQAIDEQGQ